MSVGKRVPGKLLDERQIGHAHLITDTQKPHYLLKVWAPIPLDYYLCPTQNNRNKYVLFAKRVVEDGEYKFLCPVGWGILSSELNTHIEVQFNFPHTKAFISIYPSNK